MPRPLLAGFSARASQLRYSYLFLPGLIALALAVLGVGISQLDRVVGSGISGGLFPAGPSAARDVLTTIAASLITVAGVTFSITVISLQLVSQQFTPRALRNFLGDRLNQVVAGVFVGVFLYCIVVLRSIESGEDEFTSGLGVTLAVALAFLALVLLLVFINHMAQSIQVSTIAARICRRTLQSAECLYPSAYGQPSDDDPERLVEEWSSQAPAFVHASRPGFVQTIDLVPEAIGGRGLRVRFLVAPGDFVTENHPLAAVWADGDREARLDAVRRAIAVGSERDPEQDVGYGVRQLTDIAVRALSPSVNDPTTATTCIGYLQAILERLVERPPPTPVRLFPDEGAVVVARFDDFRTYLEGLVQIGRYAEDARVVDALLSTALRVAEAATATCGEGVVDAVAECGDRIATRALERGSLDTGERDAVKRALARLQALARQHRSGAVGVAPTDLRAGSGASSDSTS